MSQHLGHEYTSTSLPLFENQRFSRENVTARTWPGTFRQNQVGVFPRFLAQRQPVALRNELGQQSWDHRHRPLIALTPGKGEDVILPGAGGLQRQIISSREQPRMLAPATQTCRDQVQLDAAVFFRPQKFPHLSAAIRPVVPPSLSAAQPAGNRGAP